MSNVDQIAVMMDLLQEMETMMGTLEKHIDTLHERGDETVRELLTAQEFTRVMYRLTAILKKMGLGTEITSVLAQISRLIYLTRMALMSLNFLEMATPYGWIMGGLGLVTTAIGTGELMSDSMVGR